MRIARTLSLYVMRETLLYCSLAFFGLTLVLLTQNLLKRLDDLFLVGMTGDDVLRVISCLAPVALSYALPLSFLLGLMLAIRRLSSDGELQGFRTAGMSPISILVPCLLLASIAAGLSSWILNFVEPASRREMVQLLGRVAARGAIIEPGKFRQVGQHLVFVEDRERDGSLAGVMIYDQSLPDRRYRVFAKAGQFTFHEDTREIQLDLQQGNVHLDPRADAPDRYERIHFEQFSYRLPVGHLLGADFGPVRPKQMTRRELRQVLNRADSGDPLRDLDQRNPLEYALEIHRREALPWAPILFAGFGVPIALASEHRGRNRTLLIVLLAAFGYYALGSMCESLASRGEIGAASAHWIPNAVYAALAVVLIERSRHQIPR